MQQVNLTTDQIAAVSLTYRQVSPNVMGGGVECQPPTPDTPGVEFGGKKPRDRRTVVRLLGCQGCQPPSRYYRVGRACAHMRLLDSSVWTPDSPDGRSNPRQNAQVSASIPGIGVRGVKHPTPDTGVRGGRGLTQKEKPTARIGGGGSGV